MLYFYKAESNVHDLVRDNLVGGPSIIFHCHHKKGETRIRAREYGSESKVCKHILGVDANSLFLKCMGEAHCTGYFVVRRRSKLYKAELTQQHSRAASKLLRYNAIVDREKILHHYNHSEVSVGATHVRVDSIVPEKRVVYQFHGCYWHGYKCHLNKQELY